MLTWFMTSSVLSIVMMLTTTCQLPSVAASAAAAAASKDVRSKVVVRRSADDPGDLTYEERNRDSLAMSKLIDRNRSLLRELLDPERRPTASHAQQPFAQYVYGDSASLFPDETGEGLDGKGGSENGGIESGTTDVSRSKRARWQGFCFAKTRTGRYLPYICWKGEVKRPAPNRSQRFERRRR